MGLFNILDGVITSGASIFQEADLVVSLQTWGWAILVIGVVQVLAGWLSSPARSALGRIIIVIISMMASFVAIGVYLFWTLIILAIDATVRWGLTVRGAGRG